MERAGCLSRERKREGEGGKRGDGQADRQTDRDRETRRKRQANRPKLREYLLCDEKQYHNAQPIIHVKRRFVSFHDEAVLNQAQNVKVASSLYVYG